MKVSTKEVLAKKFTPIELTITIETPEELNGLFARLNTANFEIFHYGYLNMQHEECLDELEELFTTVNNICKERFGCQ
jgi:hypothetical protein